MSIDSQIPAHYDGKTIRLHWITALLVILLWCLGETIDWFPRGTPRVTMRSLHISLGVILGLVIAYRIWWRSTGGVRLPPAETGKLQTLATAIHFLLYAGVVATVVIGVANVWVRGDTIFNLFTVPKLDPANKPLRETIEELHELAANIVIVLAALHAGAALMHHYLWKDQVLRRMLPGSR
ncbi:cytochrome b [Noviherbaspirillum sp. UKPF54]|uniref:cytochrome b n=1 Tax=Noviherbaspirillum sp. UKPF54 TaxID=2601898 RepID=UPI0011B121E6|nr:cytochrome b [Noviherbaspirillum sp. UKPF54]QDZ29932.1 cytochrome b [Noviherbaspirillum sp. UKPF54]